MYKLFMLYYKIKTLSFKSPNFLFLTKAFESICGNVEYSNAGQATGSPRGFVFSFIRGIFQI